MAATTSAVQFMITQSMYEQLDCRINAVTNELNTLASEISVWEAKGWNTDALEAKQEALSTYKTSQEQMQKVYGAQMTSYGEHSQNEITRLFTIRVSK